MGNKQDTLTFSAPSVNNSNPSTSAQIKSALDLKQNTLTFDPPSSDSGNPSTSAQIKSALEDKQDKLDASSRLNCEFIGSGNITNTELDALDGIDSASTIETRLANLNTSLGTAIGNISTLNTTVNTNTTNITTNANNLTTLDTNKQDKLDSNNRLNANLIGSSGSVSNAEYETLNGIDTSQSVQTQLNGKLSSATATIVYFTNISAQGKQDKLENQDGSRLNANSIGSNGNVSNTEFGYLNGVSSNIQTQLDNLASTHSITADRVCVSDGSGNLTASGITTTELNRLNNISQNIQTTLNAKLNNSSREFNQDNSEGQVRLRINSSTSDNSSTEGTSLSKFIIRSRHHRNAGGTLINTANTNVFGIFSYRQSDSNGDNQRCDLRSGLFRSNSTEYLSDDRLKWEEQPITNGLDTLMKLKPQQYQKYTEYNLEDPSIRPSDLGSGLKEYGFIAQEVAEIEELSFLVGSDINYLQPDMPIYALNYNGIYVLTVQAVQELKKELDDVKQRLSYLENKTN